MRAGDLLEAPAADGRLVLDLAPEARRLRPAVDAIDPELRGAVQATWRGRMINEHGSAPVFEGLARQLRTAGAPEEHAAEDTTSDLAFRGVLDGRSTAVWRGMINVDKGAQRTDAFQDCRNLLLSKKAHADAIPGLEILANDVRCTHAAAIAQIDPDQLFYLRSRGLDEGVAKRLVIEGFMAELVERFEEGPIRDALGGAIERRMTLILG